MPISRGIRLKEVPEVYVRYYCLFPAGWEWPKGYGLHDSIVFAGSYDAPRTFGMVGEHERIAWAVARRDTAAAVQLVTEYP